MVSAVTAVTFAMPAHADSPTPASPTQTASEQARASGQPVEVPDLTTPTNQVTAEPDGTFSLTSYRQPVRIQRAGRWVPIDTTLTQNADGSYSPGAAYVELTFSGGGSGPALTIGTPGSDASIALTWPEPLPAPSVAGDTATYADILPGADLVLTAESDSYSETIVVHDATAAANPALQDLRMTFSAHKLQLAKAADGGLDATDPAGNQVFDGAVPIAWDSSFDPHVGAAPTATDPGGSGIDPLTISLPQVNGAAGTASATAVVQTPADALVGPDVQYPVYIDPVLSRPSPAHTLAVSSGPTQLHSYDNNDGSGDLKVGYCNWGASCNSIGVARSFFSFDISALSAPYSWQDTTATVYSAEVDVYQIHNAAGCTAEPVSLYTTLAFTSATVWPGPAYSTLLGTATTNYGDSCGTGNGGNDVFNAAIVGTKVQYAASLGNVITFGLQSPNESDRNQWKRFDLNPELTVHYSYPPSQLTASGFDPQHSVVCNGTVYAKDQYPTLNGTAHDNDYPHTTLTMRFYLYDSSGSEIREGDRNIAGADGSVSIGWQDTYPTQEGTTYQYAVNAFVPVSDVSSTTDDWGTASAKYKFVAAWSSPSSDVTVGSTDYPQNNWGIAGSQSGTFHLRDDDSDALGFTYSIDGGSGSEPTPTSCTNNVATNQGRVTGGWVMGAAGQAQITAGTGLTPGEHTLYVNAFNGAMLPSANHETSYTFYVSPTSTSGISNVAEAEDSSRLSYPATTTKADGTSTTNAASSSMLNLSRWATGTDHLTVAGPPSVNGTMQASLGLAYTDATMPGVVPIYDCLANGDRVTSLVSTCSGYTRMSGSPMGYLYSSPPSGPGAPPTHALYRCRIGTDHFDSTSSICENPSNTYDGVLGYLVDAVAGLGSPQVNSLSSAYGGRYLATNSVGSQFSLTFTAPVEADYALGMQLITGPDNGKIQFSLAPTSNPGNVTALGEGGGSAPVDDYSSSMDERYVMLGGPHLTAGSYTISGTIAAAGAGGGYAAELDFVMLAPINNMAAALNSIGITADGAPAVPGGGLSGTETLSQNALAAQGYYPGRPFVAANDVTFSPFARDSQGHDNIAAASNTYTLTSPVAAGTELDLLVLSAGGDTPAPPVSFDYQLTVNYQTSTHFVSDLVPRVPNWHAAIDTSQESSPNGIITREPALTLHSYNSGATTVTGDIQLYMLRVQIAPTAQDPVVSITLPQASSGAGVGQLHVFAITPQ